MSAGGCVNGASGSPYAAIARCIDAAAENMLLSTAIGTVRRIFERELAPDKGDVVCQQLVEMCIAYPVFEHILRL